MHPQFRKRQESRQYLLTKATKTMIVYMKKTFGILLLFAVWLVSCNRQPQEQEEPAYSVMTIGRGDVTLTESYSASIQGRQDIAIYPQVSGTVRKVCVREGQTVRQGELLFVIDQVPYKAALRTAIANARSAQAQVQTARLAYESKRELLKEQVVSEYDLSTARNALAVAEASLEQAKAQEVNARNDLSYTEVRSPADGMVGTIPYRAGSLVSPGSEQPLTSVSDNSEVYVYFSMSGKQLQTLIRRYGSIDRTIKEMPAVKLRLGDGTVYEKEGRVESISGVLDRQTGSGSLRAVFPNAGRVLLSGSTGNLLIPQTLHNVISIPQEAVYELQDKLFVYKVVHGKAVSTRIEVAPVNDGMKYTVTSGLDTGDMIVTTGVGLLENGDAVNVKR